MHGSWISGGRYTLTLDLLGAEEAASFTPPLVHEIQIPFAGQFARGAGGR